MSGDGIAADTAGEVGGVRLRFGGYFDDGAGRWKEGFVAWGDVGEDEGLRVGGFGDRELEVGFGVLFGWVRGGGGRRCGRYDQFAPLGAFRCRRWLGKGKRTGPGIYSGLLSGVWGDRLEGMDGESVKEFVGEDEGGFRGICRVY